MNTISTTYQEDKNPLSLSTPKSPLFHPAMGVALFFVALWFIPTPEGIDLQTWHLFDIFVTTILAVMLKCLPMGALCILAISACTITKTLTLEQSLSSFHSPIVWLTFIAFLLARGFIKTGLGARIAYCFVMAMGKSTLGLAYGLVSTELLLAPFTPSNTARGAGIVYPIVTALNLEYGSTPELGTQRNLGAYLLKLCYQANLITSAMFLTAMAGNPLIAGFAAEIGLGVDLSWMSWCTAAIVPGLVNLALLPLVLFKIYPPSITRTPKAPEFAREKLKEMGKLKNKEWIMLATFGLLLTLWIMGTQIGIDPSTAAFLGLAILLSTGVLHWEDILKEHNAWHTFIWLATFLMMSSHLSEFGMINWCSDHVQTLVSPFHWIISLSIISLIYFYSHYLFASISAHISSMFSAFALIAITAGVPSFVAIMLLAAMSSLCAGITHYGTGTAPVFFGANFVSVKDWWRVGGILSVFNILIWATVGPAWWYMLGLIEVVQ